MCDSAKTRWKAQSSFWREAGVSGGLWRVVGLRQQQQKSLVHTGVDRLTCPRDGGNEHCKSDLPWPVSSSRHCCGFSDKSGK